MRIKKSVMTVFFLLLLVVLSASAIPLDGVSEAYGNLLRPVTGSLSLITGKQVQQELMINGVYQIPAVSASCGNDIIEGSEQCDPPGDVLDCRLNPIARGYYCNALCQCAGELEFYRPPPYPDIIYDDFWRFNPSGGFFGFGGKSSTPIITIDLQHGKNPLWIDVQETFLGSFLTIPKNDLALVSGGERILEIGNNYDFLARTFAPGTPEFSGETNTISARHGSLGVVTVNTKNVPPDGITWQAFNVKASPTTSVGLMFSNSIPVDASQKTVDIIFDIDVREIVASGEVNILEFLDAANQPVGRLTLDSSRVMRYYLGDIIAIQSPLGTGWHRIKLGYGPGNIELTTGKFGADGDVAVLGMDVSASATSIDFERIGIGFRGSVGNPSALDIDYGRIIVYSEADNIVYDVIDASMSAGNMDSYSRAARATGSELHLAFENQPVDAISSIISQATPEVAGVVLIVDQNNVDSVNAKIAAIRQARPGLKIRLMGDESTLAQAIPNAAVDGVILKVVVANELRGASQQLENLEGATFGSSPAGIHLVPRKVNKVVAAAQASGKVLPVSILYLPVDPESGSVSSLYDLEANVMSFTAAHEMMESGPGSFVDKIITRYSSISPDEGSGLFTFDREGSLFERSIIVSAMHLLQAAKWQAIETIQFESSTGAAIDDIEYIDEEGNSYTYPSVMSTAYINNKGDELVFVIANRRNDAELVNLDLSVLPAGEFASIAEIQPYFLEINPAADDDGLNLGRMDIGNLQQIGSTQFNVRVPRGITTVHAKASSAVPAPIELTCEQCSQVGGGTLPIGSCPSYVCASLSSEDRTCLYRQGSLFEAAECKTYQGESCSFYNGDKVGCDTFRFYYQKECQWNAADNSCTDISVNPIYLKGAIVGNKLIIDLVGTDQATGIAGLQARIDVQPGIDSTFVSAERGSSIERNDIFSVLPTIEGGLFGFTVLNPDESNVLNGPMHLATFTYDVSGDTFVVSASDVIVLDRNMQQLGMAAVDDITVMKETGLDDVYLEVDVSENLVSANVKATANFEVKGVQFEFFSTGGSVVNHEQGDLVTIAGSNVFVISPDPSVGNLVTAIAGLGTATFGGLSGTIWTFHIIPSADSVTVGVKDLLGVDINNNQFTLNVAPVTVNTAQPSENDIDNDGHTVSGGDCDDNNENVYPGAAEVCDGLDNDCDGTVDESNVCAVCIDGSARPCGGTNIGACRESTQICSNGQWGVCSGGIGPGDEICNGIDDNCDGITDEGCGCVDGTVQKCGIDVGQCASGTQTCSNGQFGPCVDEVGPSTEVCDATGIDEDCDGQANEGCACIIGEARSCYSGPAGTEDVGICKAGTQICSTVGAFGACAGEILPRQEICGNNMDEDCDGSDLPCAPAGTEDDDNDGILNSKDKCPDTEPGVTVNAVGCEVPVYSKLIVTPDLSGANINLRDVPGLTVEDVGQRFASIGFQQAVELTHYVQTIIGTYLKPIDLDVAFDIGPNKVAIDTVNYPSLDIPATITMKVDDPALIDNIDNLIIEKDGQPCPATECVIQRITPITDADGNVVELEVVFNVPGFSEYSIGIETSEPGSAPPPSEPAGSGGSGGTGSSGGGGGGGGLKSETYKIEGQISTIKIGSSAPVYFEIEGEEYRIKVSTINTIVDFISLDALFPVPKKLEFYQGEKLNVDYDNDGKPDFSMKLEDLASTRIATFIVEPLRQAAPITIPEPSTVEREETQKPVMTREPLPQQPIVTKIDKTKKAARSLLFAFIVVAGAILTVFLFKRRFFKIRTKDPETKKRYVEMLRKNIEMLRKEGFHDDVIRSGLLGKGWPKDIVDKEMKHYHAVKHHHRK